MPIATRTFTVFARERMEMKRKQMMGSDDAIKKELSAETTAKPLNLRSSTTAVIDVHEPDKGLPGGHRRPT